MGRLVFRRCTVLSRSEVRGKPSVAFPFVETKRHRRFILIPMAPTWIRDFTAKPMICRDGFEWLGDEWRSDFSPTGGRECRPKGRPTRKRNHGFIADQLDENAKNAATRRRVRVEGVCSKDAATEPPGRDSRRPSGRMRRGASSRKCHAGKGPVVRHAVGARSSRNMDACCIRPQRALSIAARRMATKPG